MSVQNIEYHCFQSFLAITAIGIVLSFIPTLTGSYDDFINDINYYRQFSPSYKDALHLSGVAVVPLTFDFVSEIWIGCPKFAMFPLQNVFGFSRLQYFQSFLVLGALIPLVALVMSHDDSYSGNTNMIATILCTSGVQKTLVFATLLMSCNSAEFKPSSILLAASAPLIHGFFVLCLILDILSMNSTHFDNIATVTIAAKVILVLSTLSYIGLWLHCITEKFSRSNSSSLELFVRILQVVFLVVAIPAINISFDNFTRATIENKYNVLKRAALCMALLVLVINVLHRIILSVEYNKLTGVHREIGTELGNSLSMIQLANGNAKHLRKPPHRTTNDRTNQAAETSPDAVDDNPGTNHLTQSQLSDPERNYWAKKGFTVAENSLKSVVTRYYPSLLVASQDTPTGSSRSISDHPNLTPKNSLQNLVMVPAVRANVSRTGSNYQLLSSAVPSDEFTMFDKKTISFSSLEHVEEGENKPTLEKRLTFEDLQKEFFPNDNNKGKKIDSDEDHDMPPTELDGKVRLSPAKKKLGLHAQDNHNEAQLNDNDNDEDARMYNVPIRVVSVRKLPSHIGPFAMPPLPAAATQPWSPLVVAPRRLSNASSPAGSDQPTNGVSRSVASSATTIPTVLSRVNSVNVIEFPDSQQMPGVVARARLPPPPFTPSQLSLALSTASSSSSSSTLSYIGPKSEADSSYFESPSHRDIDASLDSQALKLAMQDSAIVTNDSEASASSHRSVSWYLDSPQRTRMKSVHDKAQTMLMQTNSVESLTGPNNPHEGNYVTEEHHRQDQQEHRRYDIYEETPLTNADGYDSDDEVGTIVSTTSSKSAIFIADPSEMRQFEMQKMLATRHAVDIPPASSNQRLETDYNTEQMEQFVQSAQSQPFQQTWKNLQLRQQQQSEQVYDLQDDDDNNTVHTYDFTIASERSKTVEIRMLDGPFCGSEMGTLHNLHKYGDTSQASYDPQHHHHVDMNNEDSQEQKRSYAAYLRSLVVATNLEFRSVLFPGRPDISDLLLNATELGTHILSSRFLIEQLQLDITTIADVYLLLFGNIDNEMLNGKIDEVQDYVHVVEVLLMKTKQTALTCSEYFTKVKISNEIRKYNEQHGLVVQAPRDDEEGNADYCH